MVCGDDLCRNVGMIMASALVVWVCGEGCVVEVMGIIQGEATFSQRCLGAKT